MSKKIKIKVEKVETVKKLGKLASLTPEEREYISVIYYDEGISAKEKNERLATKFKVEGRTIRNWYHKLNLSTPISKLPKQLVTARDRSIDVKTRVLLITSAQNTTSINYKLFDSMKLYQQKIIDEFNLPTEIVVIPTRYRNPTSPSDDIKQRSDQWWVDEIEPYLFYNKIEFGDCIISADTHTRPTVKEPLNGLESICGDNSLVVGSPRIHFKTLPRFRGDSLRSMATTGSITVKNYSRSNSGDNGFVHHSYGFCVVEMKEDCTCHQIRNVYSTDDGEFTDLCFDVTPTEITNVVNTEAIIWGDIHRELIDENVYNKTKEICNKLNPLKHILHDVLDGYRFNPHERKDVYLLRNKIINNKFLIKDEVEQAVDFCGVVLKECGGDEVFVIESNHDVFLDRHITDMNWKNDLHNSQTYLEYALIQQTVDLDEHGNIFGYLINKKYNKIGVKYLKYGGKSLKIKGFNLSIHGDCGVNGSRGNIKTFKRLNTKLIHGHNHSPIIIDGVTSVGLTAILKQYYTRRGMSSHANAHAIINKYGKRQLLVFGDDYEISHFI